MSGDSNDVSIPKCLRKIRNFQILNGHRNQRVQFNKLLNNHFPEVTWHLNPKIFLTFLNFLVHFMTFFHFCLNRNRLTFELIRRGKT